MNCPSRTDDPPPDAGWNQNPPSLAADLTTCQDLNGKVNSRSRQSMSSIRLEEHGQIPMPAENLHIADGPSAETLSAVEAAGKSHSGSAAMSQNGSTRAPDEDPRKTPHLTPSVHSMATVWQIVLKFGKFIGPGFMVAVAYIDPGNYSTDVAAGASKKFSLLFIVLMSNVFAILLQSLAIRLGTVTGLNLAEHCRAQLPPWLNIFLYILGESAIIATDIAEVIGSAIALNLLIKVPLVAGCALTLVDVLVILLFYKPNGSLRRLRAFEFFVMMLVLGVVICFCIELSLLDDTSVGEVFRGYVPSAAVVQGEGLYLSCGILGATVMPHSLYLGSGIVQPRLRQFDVKAGNLTTDDSMELEREKLFYRPSLAAIKSCLSYSTVELIICLFTFALFVNSAILVVAGASLSGTEAQDADLFSIHKLLATSIAPAAGTIFALALLLSGTSAGIVCTIAGQLLSEGALNWTIAPWMRRLLTRSISITPSIIIAGAVGKEGLSAALNASQVALSVALPFVSAPLIYFTCRNKYMVVGGVRPRNAEYEDDDDGVERVKMRNHWAVSVFAIAVWLVLVIMNVALLVLVGLGRI